MEPVSGHVHANYALTLFPIWYAWSSSHCVLGYVYLVLCHHHLSEGLAPSLFVLSALVKVSLLQRFILSDFTRCPSHITVVAFTIAIISVSWPDTLPGHTWCAIYFPENLCCEYSQPILITANAETPLWGWVLCKVFVQFNLNFYVTKMWF